METFNRVWTSPETLPTKDEVANPQRWLERMRRHCGAGTDGRRPGTGAGSHRVDWHWVERH